MTPTVPGGATPVVEKSVLHEAWGYRISAGTGWPDVGVQALDDTASLRCSLCVSVARL